VKLALLTLTADRPAAFALCERWMRAQTAWDSVAFWAVVANGQQVPTLTANQTILRPSGCLSDAPGFLRSLAFGLHQISGQDFDAVAFIEDDDYYPPTYLESLLGQLNKQDLAGIHHVPYWHAQKRLMRPVISEHAALAFTAIRRRLIPALQHHIGAELMTDRPSPFVDTWLWDHFKGAAWVKPDCVAVKGMPGTPGIGLWHRKQFASTPDPHGFWLRSRIGADADAYLGLEYPS